MADKRSENVYFAKLAEQAERYDEMADYMFAVGGAGIELSVEERNLLSVAYKNAVGSRRAAWRIITSVEQKERTKGNNDQADFAKEYLGTVEQELQKICDRILGLLADLVPLTPSGESKVFYVKMKADYYRYIAEFTLGDKKRRGIARCEEGLSRGHRGGYEGLGGDASNPPWACTQLLSLHVRGTHQP